VVDQYTETQYDDDLTIGTEDYDDSYYTDTDDLFAFASDDESPISRLRSLVLSIDWEITDEVLTQFNEELADLKDVWAGDKVNLVYVQALEKISRYIYQRKADAHPNAIKLLLSLYYNLEKIVSDHDLSETEKHELLTEDVKRFENLKKVIAKKSAPEPSAVPKKKAPKAAVSVPQVSGQEVLLKLKAIVLGIDWEITDQDLSELKAEVLRLEKIFSSSRPKLILLQGIGTLGAYIKVKKSNAHADAFKVLHLFYDSLEKIVAEQMTLDEEKEVLFPAVEKFNKFKSLLGPTISPEALSRGQEDEAIDEDEDDSPIPPGSLSPALADYQEEAVTGFQEDEEIKTLGEDQGVLTKINDFFRDDSFPDETPAPAVAPASTKSLQSGEDESSVDEALSAFERSFGGDEPGTISPVSSEVALQGVDVEYDDDDEEEDGLPGGVATASVLSEAAVDDDAGESQPLTLETPAEEKEVSAPPLLAGDDESSAVSSTPVVEAEVALQGVAVETEADDDSELEALPRDDGELAPALLDSDEESTFSASSLQGIGRGEAAGDELTGTLANFFGSEAEDDSVAEEEPAMDFAAPESAPIEEEPVENMFAADEGEVDAFEQEISPAGGLDKGEEEVWPAAPAESIAGVEDDVEMSLESELDEQIDDFFANEDGEEPAPALADVETGDESVAVVAESDDFQAAAEQDSDEVVFALVDGDSGEDIGQPAELDAVDIAVEEAPLADVDEFLEETFAEQEDVFSEVPEQIDASDLAVSEVDNLFTADISAQDVQGEPYQTLLACVESIALELDDKVIGGLKQEISSLGEEHVSASISEKMLLQLLSTVTQHIDSYRYEASAESFTLLKEISAALADCAGNDTAAQDSMLSLASKVLQWQQDMLHKQAVAKGGSLTFVAPIRSDESEQNISDAQMDFDSVFEVQETDNGEGVIAAGDTDDEELWDDEVATLTDDMFGSEIDSGAEQVGLAGEGDLRSEIDKLRQTLQEEIAQLRRELLSK